MPRINFYVDDELQGLIDRARKIDSSFNLSKVVRGPIEKATQKIIATKKKNKKSKKLKLRSS